MRSETKSTLARPNYTRIWGQRWLASRRSPAPTCFMARRLRLQFPGARYHVINRGNLQHDVFVTAGAIKSFLGGLEEACTQYGWRVYAFVVMRNHYHLALETPEPNLVEGMHWLQGTFATRLNRFHRQHGHVFQGRYKALLIEDANYLAQVIDYIHLNPVRASIVPPADIDQYRWSSLWRFLQGTERAWLVAPPLLQEADFADASKLWRQEVERLVEIATSPQGDDRTGRGALSRGWAIGTAGWRRALAREHAQLALSSEMSADELRDFKHARWQRELDLGLAESGKTIADIACTPKGIPWKIALAVRLRAKAAAPYEWIAQALNMGAAASVRVYVSRAN